MTDIFTDRLRERLNLYTQLMKTREETLSTVGKLVKDLETKFNRNSAILLNKDGVELKIIKQELERLAYEIYSINVTAKELGVSLDLTDAEKHKLKTITNTIGDYYYKFNAQELTVAQPEEHEELMKKVLLQLEEMSDDYFKNILQISEDLKTVNE